MQISQKSRGFTLVELLVVIGVIGLLIGLLMPSLARAREQARAIKCASQLRQVGIALNMYANANKGFMPAWSGWHVVGGNGTGEDAPGPGWTEQLTQYFVNPNSQVYNCPSFPEDYRINYFLAARWTMVRNERAMRLSTIRRSTEFVLSGDCTQRGLYPQGFGNTGFSTDDCDKDDATQEGVVFANQSGGLNVHKAGNNVLFGDGHVELKRQWDSISMTCNPHKMQAWATVTAD